MGCCLLPFRSSGSTESRQAPARPHTAGEPPNLNPNQPSWGPDCTLGMAALSLCAEGGDPAPRGARAGSHRQLRMPLMAPSFYHRPPATKQTPSKLADSTKKAFHKTHWTRHFSHSDLNLLLIRNHSSVPMHFLFPL